ncbi:hypothetical protein OC846_005924 [Tilletia horrida]|uniref:UBX domain-containing protein n=1 Tax=Tilletia horrida TaxID=155126 RepID=A0AAN6GJV8_9BASI|nr:hypothetical protein OC846_005924 [Tilletia horrida]
METSQGQQQPEASSSAPSASAIKVFLPANASAGPSRASQILASPLPEEQSPSPAELKQAFAGTLAGRHGPDAPLMTKAMRERENAKYGIVKKTYTTVRLRVRFSNGTQLENTFPASATLTPVYNFVRSSLAPAYTSKKFTLYVSPPKRDLGESDPKLKGKTLAELGLIPAAVVNIRWEDSAMNSNTHPAPLSAELLGSAQEVPAPPSFDNPAASSGSSSTSSSTPADGTAKKEPKALPKWLKAGFKK